VRELDAVVNDAKLIPREPLFVTGVVGNGVGVGDDFVDEEITDGLQISREAVEAVSGGVVQIAAGAEDDGNAGSLANPRCEEVGFIEKGLEYLEFLAFDPAGEAAEGAQALTAANGLDVEVGNVASGDSGSEPIGAAKDADLRFEAIASGDADELEELPLGAAGGYGGHFIDKEQDAWPKGGGGRWGR
jgi:hypothetical protein